MNVNHNIEDQHVRREKLGHDIEDDVVGRSVGGIVMTEPLAVSQERTMLARPNLGLQVA